MYKCRLCKSDSISVILNLTGFPSAAQKFISDILVPNWTNANHISQFSLLQDYLSAVAASNTSAANAVSVEARCVKTAI